MVTYIYIYNGREHPPQKHWKSTSQQGNFVLLGCLLVFQTQPAWQDICIPCAIFAFVVNACHCTVLALFRDLVVSSHIVHRFLFTCDAVMKACPSSVYRQYVKSIQMPSLGGGGGVAVDLVVLLCLVIVIRVHCFGWWWYPFTQHTHTQIDR